jgi:hypothetical protein
MKYDEDNTIEIDGSLFDLLSLLLQIDGAVIYLAIELRRKLL